MDACVRACVRLEVTCVGAGRICASAQEERELLACLSNHDWATVPANLKWRALAWLWYVCSSTTSSSSSSGCGMYVVVPLVLVVVVVVVCMRLHPLLCLLSQSTFSPNLV